MASWRSSAAAAALSHGGRGEVTAYLGIGSNTGDRLRHITSAVRLLRALPHCAVLRTSHMYESSPVGLTSQPLFLNAALELRTALPPLSLLSALKAIERALGRDMAAVRFGPRVIDIDVLTYGRHNINSETLTVPHPRMHERRFVLQPLADLIVVDDTAAADDSAARPASLPEETSLTATAIRRLLAALSDSPQTAADVAYRVLSLSSSVFRHDGRNLVMGIVNRTPDSFSDGGSPHSDSLPAAVEFALRLRSEGADVLDVGGESTRPGAVEVSASDEQRRILPLIAALHAIDPTLPISVDTRHSDTARRAVEAGACMVNDVSGGLFDPAMLSTVADTGAAYCAMHARGVPSDMVGLARYDDVVKDVRAELSERLLAAEEAGIARWNILQDPGLGFAKTQQHNVSDNHFCQHALPHRHNASRHGCRLQ